MRCLHAATREESLPAATREKSSLQQRPSTAKNKQINKIIKADRGPADPALDHELLKKEGCVLSL